MTNHPFEDTIKQAVALAADGHWLFQKFTCSVCSNRLTMDEANTFHTHGTCDKCGALTNIYEAGCNYTLWASNQDKTELATRLGFKPPLTPNVITVKDSFAAVERLANAQTPPATKPTSNN